jgi:hypothetical protein
MDAGAVGSKAAELEDEYWARKDKIHLQMPQATEIS